MKRKEFLIVVTFVLFAGLIVSNNIQLPSYVLQSLNSPITKIILIIATLYGFSVSPAVGLAATVLTAVLIFSHNVNFVNNLRTSNPLYNNTFTNFVRNLFTPSTVDTKLVHNESAEYAEMIEVHPAEGSYPSDEARVIHSASTLEYNYRPQEDSGSDEFIRYGPNIDEKLEVLHE
jgi:hypothetical protein